MTHLLISMLIFASVFACALIGMYVRTRLPGHHVDEESGNAIKLATGLIATIAALVLGLMISSAKGSFDTVNSDLERNAVNILRLDRTLAQYGPEAQDLRVLLKRNYASWIDIVATGPAASLGSPQLLKGTRDFQQQLAQLSPATATQRQLQNRALEISDNVFAARWLALQTKKGAIPMTLLLVLASWLCVIFGTFGLFAPHNHTVIFFFLLCALSAAGAIFVILEMDTPLNGIVKVSVAPMREALSELGL
ncbi:bestrophin-like domain [Dyella soli]|uniref:DUF4239 domain-containing protein n=1 Tax=Dyella soli TaxID=522319 RepID=A0A4R0YP57_9GAMM|nr:hypothetical protein [Dyella soli]TCI06455.1 hypothetical protein EZM97_33780 [Dyella soli]